MSARWRIPDQAELSALQASIKERAREVRFGTGTLQDEFHKAKARNAKRLKSSPGARGARGMVPGATKAQERGKSTPGKPRLREAQVLRACMDILEASPKVFLWWRQNTGAMKKDGRYLKFSFKGASDLMGVMAGTGKFLAVECKATGKLAEDDQAAFLNNVSKATAYSMCVDDPAFLAAWLAEI